MSPPTYTPLMRAVERSLTCDLTTALELYRQSHPAARVRADLLGISTRALANWERRAGLTTNPNP